MRTSKWFLVTIIFSIVCLAGCGDESNASGSCTVAEHDGEITMTCPDGTRATIRSGTDGKDGKDGQDGKDGVDGAKGADGQDGKDGVDGADGEPCVAVDNHDGTKTITCPDGSEVVVQDLDALDVVVEGHLVIANPFQVTQMLMVTEVTGNLVFQSYGSTAISLPNLKKVGGNLHIDNHSNLKNVSMPRLQTVEGNVSIQNAPRLESLEGFNALETIGGNFSLYETSALENLEGLNALETIGGQFQIVYSSALTSLDGLDALRSIGNNLYIRNNAKLCQTYVDDWLDAYLLTGTLGGETSFIANNGTCE